MNTAEENIDLIFGHALAACKQAGIAEDNVKFENVLGEVPEQASWAKVYMKHGPSSRASVGTGLRRRFRRTGVLWIKLHVPLGDGTANHVPLTQKVIAYFERLKTPISYVNIRGVEDGTHGLFYVTDFMTEFSYDVFN